MQKSGASRSKFEQCSNVRVGKQEFCFFGLNKYCKCIVGAKKPHDKQLDFIESA